MRRCISIRGCVCPSVGPSVRPSPVIFRRVRGASCAVYPVLFNLKMKFDFDFSKNSKKLGGNGIIRGAQIRENTVPTNRITMMHCKEKKHNRKPFEVYVRRLERCCI